MADGRMEFHAQTIMQHEPRISDVSIDTEFRSDIGAVIININYLVSAINRRDNLVFPFYLDRGGDVEEEKETEPLERRYSDNELMMEDDETWT